MLLDIQATDKVRNGKSAEVGALMRSLFEAIETASIDSAKLRVVCDWIQYKNNFRAPVDFRPIHARTHDALEIAIDLRRSLGDGVDVRQAVAHAAAEQRQSDRVYLEPFGPTRKSIIWDFNGLYWKFLSHWEDFTKKGYESALPGGESDAMNAGAARESIRELFATWDFLAERRALPDQLHVIEIGVGVGNQARVWLDEFQRLDAEHGRDYYRRLQYLMGDYSPHLLEAARKTVSKHGDHVSGLVLDATQPTATLGFLKYKAFFVYISNVYDNLPTDEVARVGGRDYLVESRAYVAAEDAASLAKETGVPADRLPDAVRRLLRLGPEVFAESAREWFADVDAVVRFWHLVWNKVCLEEQYVPLQPVDAYEIAPGNNGAMLGAILETNGDVRLHVSNGALASFIDTLTLLHPHGFIKVHDLFVTARDQYATTFRGPGKYEGSVVNWVNGPLLASVAARKGFEVQFQPFSHRKGSNIVTMTARIRE